MGQVALEPAWDEPHHLSLRIGVAGLFGALVVQLALAIAKTDGLTLRSACGMTYLPGRRPNPKRRRYCSPCRAGGAPLRDAAADYRRPPGHGIRAWCLIASSDTIARPRRPVGVPTEIAALRYSLPEVVTLTDAHPALRRKWSACTPDLNRCVDRSSRRRALDRP